MVDSRWRHRSNPERSCVTSLRQVRFPLVHHFQVVDSKRLKIVTHTIDRTAWAPRESRRANSH
jgi:hypothetical protein